MFVFQTLPKVNKELALKLMSQPAKGGGSGTLLGDERFQGMFQNPDFEIDKAADEFR
jgi:hypothetical protein